MPVDPQLLALFERADAVPPPSVAGAVRARADFEALASNWPREPVRRRRRRSCRWRRGSLPARLYHPITTGERPPVDGVVVFFHGGGWVLGSIETHDSMCRSLCNQSGLPVLNVTYRLAPEDPFPAGVDDAIAAVAWVDANRDALGVRGPLAVAGDSAGANLSAVVCLAARDAGGPPIAFQALLYPATDLRMRSASFDAFGDGYLLTRTEVEWYVAQYLGDSGAEQVEDWRTSPLLAADVAGLPPALIVTAEYDPLRDEAEAYGTRMADAGVSVTIRRWPGAVHGFVMLPGIDIADGGALRRRRPDQVRARSRPNRHGRVELSRTTSVGESTISRGASSSPAVDRSRAATRPIS